MRPRRTRCSRCNAPIPFQPWSSCDKCRAYRRGKSETRRTIGHYEPIDEWLRRPEVRILRFLRWNEWADPAEIRAGLSIPVEKCRERDTHDKALGRLVQKGTVQRVPVCGVYHYRLAPGVRIVPPNDTEVIDDGYLESGAA